MCLVGLCNACALAENYLDPDGPRYSGNYAQELDAASDLPDLKIVTFNIKFGREYERAGDELLADSQLSTADILLLQEMDAVSTDSLAQRLGMNYVYYPGSVHHDEDFGNAVLSRWPIVDDEKLILPHLAFFNRLQRTATVATLDVNGTRVRVYSMHLATRFNLAPWKRREQMAAILDDAAEHDRVIIGGDLNSTGLSRTAVERGFTWPTRDVPPTIAFFRWDHVYYRGLEAALLGAGTVWDNRNASDHAPVWVRLALPPGEIELLPGRPAR